MSVLVNIVVVVVCDYEDFGDYQHYNGQNPDKVEEYTDPDPDGWKGFFSDILTFGHVVVARWMSAKWSVKEEIPKKMS